MQPRPRRVLKSTLLVVSLIVIVGLSYYLFMPDGHAQQVLPVQPVVRSFATAGITKVILRAGVAESAKVVVVPGATDIEVLGVPTGGAKGYHSVDPNWKETPASEWGLDFVSKVYGDVLVISTKAEIRHIHHGYLLRPLIVKLPPDVELVRVPRKLTGDGAADLSK